MTEGEDRTWQRLDKWLWCARFGKTRADCARLVQAGPLRLNRQPTDKPHARLRPGDILVFPARGPGDGDVCVLRVLALAARRGPAPEARTLYQLIPAESGTRGTGGIEPADAETRDLGLPAP